MSRQFFESRMQDLNSRTLGIWNATGWIDHWDNYWYGMCVSRSAKLYPSLPSAKQFFFDFHFPPIILAASRTSHFGSQDHGSLCPLYCSYAQCRKDLVGRNFCCIGPHLPSPEVLHDVLPGEHEMWRFTRVILVGMHPNFLNIFLDDLIVWCDAGVLWQIQLLLVRGVFSCYASLQLILIFMRQQETSGKICSVDILACTKKIWACIEPNILLIEEIQHPLVGSLSHHLLERIINIPDGDLRIA